nr:unnamed protein product [Callosobruchus chinensis]
MVNTRLPRELRVTITKLVGDSDHASPSNNGLEDHLEKRATCSKCPPRLKTKTQYGCVFCKKPICLQCSRKRISLTSAMYESGAIRRIVHNFFFRNEFPTVDKVLKVVNDDKDLPSFRRIQKTRKEQLIVRKRGDCYLETRISEENQETWVNAGHTQQKVWMDSSVKSSRQAFMDGLSTGLKNPSGKEKRLIICHIGSVDGFVPDALWAFESKKTGDYHEEMDGASFENWFSNTLSKIEENAVIVLDNAAYHTRKIEKIPTMSTKKLEIQEWLNNKNIDFDSTMVKAELLQLVREHKNKYNLNIIDEMAKKQNKTWDHLKGADMMQDVKQICMSSCRHVHLFQIVKNLLYKYGDQAYGIQELLLCPFTNRDLTPQQEAFNNSMKPLRQAVEWGFGKVVNEFAFLDFKKIRNCFCRMLDKCCNINKLSHNIPIVNQGTYYSGHKRFHCSVLAPDGMIISLVGPFEGRTHDAEILRESNLYEQLQTCASLPDGQKFIYGDQAYGIQELLLCPFSNRN